MSTNFIIPFDQKLPSPFTVKQFIRMISLKSESEWIAQNSPLYMASEMASNGSFYALSKFWKAILALCAGQHKK